jgi:hypothetical protein
MSFVNGVFTRLYNWVNDKNANIDITASRFDAEDDGFATGLSTCMLKDGTQTLTANIPFAAFKITGYGTTQVPNARSDVPNLGQVQDGVLYFVAGGGTSDAITAGYSPALTVLVDGQLCYVRATAANTTTTPTFSPNSLTARTITKRGGQALLVGDIPGANAILELRYDLANTRWELLNPAGFIITTPISNFLSGDVNLSNTGTFFDGPSVAQGTSGTWFVCGSVAVQDTSGAANYIFKLWDGTTIISTTFASASASAVLSVAMSGFMTSPAGNLRISVEDTSSTNGKIKFNLSGSSKDSYITAVRIA